jgi:hypothetical protein
VKRNGPKLALIIGCSCGVVVVAIVTHGVILFLRSSPKYLTESDSDSTEFVMVDEFCTVPSLGELPTDIFDNGVDLLLTDLCEETL